MSQTSFRLWSMMCAPCRPFIRWWLRMDGSRIWVRIWKRMKSGGIWSNRRWWKAVRMRMAISILDRSVRRHLRAPACFGIRSFLRKQGLRNSRRHGKNSGTAVTGCRQTESHRLDFTLKEPAGRRCWLQQQRQHTRKKAMHLWKSFSQKAIPMIPVLKLQKPCRNCFGIQQKMQFMLTTMWHTIILSQERWQWSRTDTGWSISCRKNGKKR